MADGRRQLTQWIHRRMFSQREAAAHLGLSEPCLSLLLTGKRSRPTVETAVAIQRWAGIPVEAWVSRDGESDVEATTDEHARKRA